MKFSEKMNTVLISKLVKQEHATKGDDFLIRDPTLVYQSYRKAKYAELLANNALPDGLCENKKDIEKHDVTRKTFHLF